jgi:hypothetical protein
VRQLRRSVDVTALYRPSLTPILLQWLSEKGRSGDLPAHPPRDVVMVRSGQYRFRRCRSGKSGDIGAPTLA